MLWRPWRLRLRRAPSRSLALVYFLKSDFQSLAACEKFPFDFQCSRFRSEAPTRPYTAAAEKMETERALVRCIKNYKKNSPTRTFSTNSARRLLVNKSHRPHQNKACVWLDWKIIRVIFKDEREDNDRIVLQNNLYLQVLTDKLDEVSPAYQFSPHVSPEFQKASLKYTEILWREKQKQEARETLEQELAELSESPPLP